MHFQMILGLPKGASQDWIWQDRSLIGQIRECSCDSQTCTYIKTGGMSAIKLRINAVTFCRPNDNLHKRYPAMVQYYSLIGLCNSYSVMGMVSFHTKEELQFFKRYLGMLRIRIKPYMGLSGIWTLDLSHPKRESYPLTNKPLLPWKCSAKTIFCVRKTSFPSVENISYNVKMSHVIVYKGTCS